MKRFRIIETDNFGGDYPNEKFLSLWPVNEAHAESICKAINDGFNPPGHTHDRFYRVVQDDYKLVPGFES